MNDALQQVRSPAIALLIFGLLNGLTGLLSLLSGLLRLSGFAGREMLPANDAERFGYVLGTAVAYGVGFLSVIAAPIIVYGAIKMMHGRKYGLSKASAILAIVPLTSCCFVIGIPIGVWALIILRRPETRMLFNRVAASTVIPPPPQSW